MFLAWRALNDFRFAFIVADSPAFGFPAVPETVPTFLPCSPNRMMSGQGAFGNAVGLLPALAKDMRDQEKEEKAGGMMGQDAAGATMTPGMKKGGKVKGYAKGGKVKKYANGGLGSLDGMGAGLGGLGAGMAGASVRGAAREMAEEAAMKKGQKQEKSMLDRLGQDAMETARSYGKLYKEGLGMKKGGEVKKHAKGGSVSSASKRADGCAIRGKTRGKMV